MFMGIQLSPVLTDAVEAKSWILGRLTRLICFDRHNRFDHHDFRVMAAGTSTVWAFYVQVSVPMRLPDASRE
jgi:hypothetical protein